MSIIRVKKHPRDFTTVANAPFNEKGMSFGAKGVLIYLLTKHDNWTVRVKDLENQTISQDTGKKKDGWRKIQGYLKELQTFGYAKLVSVRDPETGKMGGKEWVIHEIKQENNRQHQNGTIGAKTDNTKNRQSVSTTVGKRCHIVNTDSLVNTDLIKKKEEETPAGNDFEQFTRAYGVMSNGPLMNAWCDEVEKSPDPKETKRLIKEHLPGYMARTDAAGNDNKRYRSTAINYLKKCLWLNDLNPKEVSATVVPKSRYRSLSN